MTKRDWQELIYWIAMAGSILTIMLMCFAVSDAVVSLVEAACR